MPFVITLALGAVLVNAAGCSGDSPKRGPEASTHRAAALTDRLAIDDALLEERNFVSHWKSQPVQRIDQCWFLLDNIYITRKNRADEWFLEKIDGETGRLAWSWQIDGRLEFAPTVYRYDKDKHPGRNDELFYAQHIDSGGEFIFCLDDKFGALKYDITCNFPISTSPVAGEKHVFVGSWNYRVYSMSKQGKAEEWTFITEDPVTASPVTSEFEVFVGSEDGIVYSFNQEASFQPGKSWRIQTAGKIVAPPLFFKNMVYVGSWDYKVYALQTYRGSPKWVYSAGAPVTQRPFPFKDRLFVVTEKEGRGGQMKHNLIALDSISGTVPSGGPHWERANFKSVLAVDSFHCYAVDETNTIHALRLDDGVAAWKLDTDGFDFLLGQDAHLGAAPEMWGRIYVASTSGVVQCIRPRR